MKHIFNYITEKLHLTKDSCAQEPPKPVKRIYFMPNGRDIEKMRYYKYNSHNGKGSNPQTLVNSIKNNTKLGNRFAVAVDLSWDEAITAFGDALVDRGCYTREEIDAYIKRHYIESDKK